MKIIGKTILLSVLVVALASCNTFAPEPTETPIPTLIPSTNTPEPTATLTATATATLSAPTATEVPVNVRAPYDETAVPKEDIVNAFEQAKIDGKLVMLVFGANWCVDCRALAVHFEKPEIKPLLKENFHVVRIDVGNFDKNLNVAQQYGNPIQNGIPAAVVLTQKGRIIATTKDGPIAFASTSYTSEVLDVVKEWVALKP